MVGRYRLLAGPGSPYSHKVRAVLRYRRIPHDWIVPLGAFRGGGAMGEGTEIARAGKRQIPVIQFPDDGSYHCDSTPIIDELEKRHQGRSVVPDDPGQAFLARLIEEFADEWLMLPMFDYRWANEADRYFCPRRQMAGWLGAVPDAELEEAVDNFLKRQEFIRQLIGGTEENRPMIRGTWEELMEGMERHLSESLFLFGSRPSIGDIGLYGQLTQYAIDPTTSNMMKERAPRLFQWVQLVDDMSGVEGEWRDPSAPLTTGAKVALTLMGEVCLPYLQAALDKVLAGEKQLETTIRGVTFASLARPYPAHTLLWLKAGYEALPDDARGRIDPVLKESGCLSFLAFREGEKEAVPPYAMA